jgi:hypothetical protein
VVNRLAARLPALRLTVQTTLTDEVIRRFVSVPFAKIDLAPDFGMLMRNALDVRVDASLAAYRELHAHWDERVEAQAQLLEQAKPDLVLANIPYLVLAAAARLEIPAVALCSLNWAEVFKGICRGRPDVESIYQDMVRAYASARVFLRPTPSMPMPGLRNAKDIGPIARLSPHRRSELNKSLGLASSTRLIALCMGGMSTPLPLHNWPEFPNIFWLLAPDQTVERPDMQAWTALNLGFIDILASCDALVTKPGYGSVAEVVCNGVPTLYVARGNWPEEPHLVRWLEHQGRAVKISRAELQTGQLLEPLQRLWRMPPKPPVAPTGIEDAAAVLLDLLG